jgi:NAD(P)-dependent dehydrogenase (short-subunit alcohol dehydrogenase family)
MENPFSLMGKKIVVAGCCSEPGRSIVTQLVELGASVFAIDISSSKQEESPAEASESGVSVYLFDYYENKEIEPFFKDLCKRIVALDGFVYCGGIGGARPLSMTRNDFLINMMNANLYTFIEMVRCITKRDCFSPGGSIVAISSVSSIKGLKSKTAYSASKAALDASIRCIAAELGEKKIRVNSILKGWLDSDMNKDFIMNNMELNIEKDFNNQFLGIMSSEDIANSVSFLLSDASKYITGTALVVDGGYTL